MEGFDTDGSDAGAAVRPPATATGPLAPSEPVEGAAPLDVETLGQVFTPPEIVDTMLGLREGAGRTLEPSCGNGAFYGRIPGCTGVEFDPRVAPPGALVMDFFDYPDSEKFACVIGNPPYVRFQDIHADTKAKLDVTGYDRRTNLCVFFIDKCLRHLDAAGEMILIVPREFMKATSGRALNERLHAQGTVTDLIDLGDRRVFKGFSPNCVIFRYVKGDLSHRRRDGAIQVVRDGLMSFVHGNRTIRLGDFLAVKVGAVSGDDGVFCDPEFGYFGMVGSKTHESGQVRQVIPDAPTHPPTALAHLARHEAQLRARRIRKFGDDDWWRWGRSIAFPGGPRLYVNAKTRTRTPFFVHDCTAWDGAVLALFPLRPDLDRAALEAVAAKLNAVDWNELGFVCDGRIQFGQRSLESAMLGAEFAEYLPEPASAEKQGSVAAPRPGDGTP